MPSERFACAIRYRLQTSFVLRDTVYFFPFRALERILGHSFETFIFSRDVLLFDRVVSKFISFQEFSFLIIYIFRYIRDIYFLLDREDQDISSRKDRVALIVHIFVYTHVSHL